LGITLWEPPHAYANRRWENLARMQQSIVYMMITRLIICGKAGDFRSVPDRQNR